MAKDTVKERVSAFDLAVENRLAEDDYIIEDPNLFYLDDEDGDDLGNDWNPNVPTDAEYDDMIQEPKPDIEDIETYDKYLNSEFVIDRGGEQVRARVAKRARSDSGLPIGRSHTNPLFDTREYECVTEDGVTERYSANVIAENIYAQCDDEGRSMLVLDQITDHRKDDSAISIADGYTVSHNGNRTSKRTTRGWQLLCTWKDGSSDWIALKDLKDSNPIELAEYAVANKIQEEPAFKWWVAETLRRRNRIINKVKSRYWKTTHKFGV
jgi:hypothetical protein